MILATIAHFRTNPYGHPKLLGYYNYYGVTGNSQSLNSFVYQVIGLLFKWLNRRSQRKSYKWEGFIELVKCFGIAKPRILHAL